MNESIDPGMEQFMREAYAREDVHHFKRLLGEVAERVEKEHVEVKGRVIPIGGRASWAWMAAAASLALVATIAISLWMRPDHQDLAYQAALPHTRGEDALTYYCGDPILDSAMYQVRMRHPQAALTFLEGFAANAPLRNCQRDWVKALALLMHEKTDEAEVLLKSVAGSACSSESGYAEDLLKEI